jgi:DNA gyrase subunit A
VRGIALPADDKVISLCILRHVETTSDERTAYLKMRRAMSGEIGVTEAGAGEIGADEAPEVEGEETASGPVQISQERYVEMSAAEQVVLTVSINGYGKRTSSYEYRTTGRGGKGIVAMSVNNRNGKLVASFPVEDSDQIMLVTDKGQLIRCPVDGIRIAGRSTQGVIVFNTADDEHVVSVEHIGEETENGANGGGQADQGNGDLPNGE